MSRFFTVIVFIVTAVLACGVVSPLVIAQGVLLRGIGAVNESVAGTATGMPLDAIGALHWNPASISALPKSEMAFSLGLFQPKTSVRTSGNSNAGLNNITDGESGITPVPSMGIVWCESRRSPFTFGLGMGAVGGAASVYSHDTNNAVLAATGHSATVIVLQVTPTVAVQVTERWSLGVAPIIDLASLTINPMRLGRNAADPLMTYGTKYVWGGGFQVGSYYDFQNHFKAGFMVKSPIWAERLYFTGTTTEPSNNTFDLNLPLTLSMGFSYDGFRNTVVGMDVRYLDYSNTAGFDKGMEGGVVKGLDWESVFSLCLGLERKVNEDLKVRLGYSWNENPIPSRSAYSSISAPMFTQHVFSCGFSYAIMKNLELSAAYVHAFEAKLSGDIPVAGGTVTNTISADSIFAGVTKKW